MSDVTVAQLAEAQAIAPVVCVQNRYSLDDRTHDTVLRACTEQGIAFVPFFAIAGDGPRGGHAGRRRGADERRPRATEPPPAQVRLAWTLHQAPNVLAIPGTGNLAHLDENVAAGTLRLSAEELASLD